MCMKVFGTFDRLGQSYSIFLWTWQWTFRSKDSKFNNQHKIGGKVTLSLWAPWHICAAEVQCHSGLISVLNGGESTSYPGRLTPRKQLGHPNTELGKPQSRSGCLGQEIYLPLSGFEPEVVQPVEESLDRLCYPGFHCSATLQFILVGWSCSWI